MKMTIFFIVAVSIVLFLCVPFAPIWALNTVFDLSIQYNFKTWLGMLIIVSVIAGSNFRFKK